MILFLICLHNQVDMVAKAGILRVQRVNMLHEFLFILPLSLAFGVLVIDI